MKGEAMNVRYKFSKKGKSTLLFWGGGESLTFEVLDAILLFPLNSLKRGKRGGGRGKFS